MNKTQIQVPDELYRELKSFAKAREWALAETFRRGAELLSEVYDDRPVTPSSPWSPPVSSSVGWKGLNPEQLREVSFYDSDPVIPTVLRDSTRAAAGTALSPEQLQRIASD